MERILPKQLLDSLQNIESFDKDEFEKVHYHPQQVTSVRFNREKFSRLGFDNITHPEFELSEKVSWCSDAFYLKERPQFIFDPLIHAGAYYVQEASSMFLWKALEQIFDRYQNIKILDLCAAPGGKTNLIASYFKNALIVSNEVIKARANILYENVTKWGSENIVVTNNDAADFRKIKNYFDLIVIDAPCSGSGLFRKDAEAINEWSEDNVQLCSYRQQRIITDVYSSLKQDGILIYSTCSYSEEEDENILDWILENFNTERIQFELDSSWHIDETRSKKNKAFGYRFWPFKLKGEGFFIAAFKKNDDEPASKTRFSNLPKATSGETSLIKEYIKDNDWLFFKYNNVIRIVPKKFESDISLLQKNLFLKKAGIQAGETKGKDFIPHHELALSMTLNESISKVDFNKAEALQYLRKKEVHPGTALKGWTLSTYNSFPLGWIKILHNRVNNYYPSEWRILKE